MNYSLGTTAKSSYLNEGKQDSNRHYGLGDLSSEATFFGNEEMELRKKFAFIGRLSNGEDERENKHELSNEEVKSEKMNDPLLNLMKSQESLFGFKDLHSLPDKYEPSNEENEKMTMLMTLLSLLDLKKNLESQSFHNKNEASIDSKPINPEKTRFDSISKESKLGNEEIGEKEASLSEFLDFIEEPKQRTKDKQRQNFTTSLKYDQLVREAKTGNLEESCYELGAQCSSVFVTHLVRQILSRSKDPISESKKYFIEKEYKRFYEELRKAAKNTLGVIYPEDVDSVDVGNLTGEIADAVRNISAHLTICLDAGFKFNLIYGNRGQPDFFKICSEKVRIKGLEFREYLRAGVNPETISEYNSFIEKIQSLHPMEFEMQWIVLEKKFKEQLFASKKYPSEFERPKQSRPSKGSDNDDLWRHAEAFKKPDLLFSVADSHLPLTRDLWVLTVVSNKPKDIAFLILEGVDSNGKYVVGRCDLVETKQKGGFPKIVGKLLSGIEPVNARERYNQLRRSRVSSGAISTEQSESWSISEEQRLSLQTDIERDSKRKRRFASSLSWVCEKLQNLNDKRMKIP